MGNMVMPAATGFVITDETGWRFKLGQCISHKDQSLPSLVMTRVRTTKGYEVYGVRRMEACAAPDLMILGDSLVDVALGSEPCVGCLLLESGMCPSAVR